jgi:hypothetical protein
MRAARTRAAALLALGALGVTLSGGACRSPPGSVLVLVVTVTGTAPPIASLEVILDGTSGRSSNQYSNPHPGPIAFPTTLSAVLPSGISGDLAIQVAASQVGGGVVASGRAAVRLTAGSSLTIYVHLDCPSCSSGGGSADGGAGDGAAPDTPPSCGNGRIDPGETCDTAIAAPAPGACPRADCDDGIACTTDTATGAACTLACAHDEIRVRAAGDGCCPAGATNAGDPDCLASCGNGSVDPGETCDTALPHGVPGACPSGPDCDDGDPCTRDLLISASTCAAICEHTLITQQSGATADGCCPVGAWAAVDTDCPVACGNGMLESGETCDVALPPGAGGCAAACDDGDPCTTDFLAGAGCGAACAHTAITGFLAGDGCCPVGGNHAVDDDCPAACGNGVLEPGEACDKAAGVPAACPTSCPASPSACVRRTLAGSASDCSARCETALVTACSATADGCCPAGCTAPADPDCSPACGNGVVDTALHETCDIAIHAGAPGACATSCNDGNACTQDLLVGAGTCSAACVFVPITAPRAGDGCCPAGANFALDPDCAPACGNGVVEPPAESCDFAAAFSACPVACPAAGACTVVELAGTGSACSARCVARAIGTCGARDGCCPPACTAATDPDCPAVCGDGVVSPGEACDRGISAGLAGSCPPSCDDADACTSDFASGSLAGCSRVCTHDRITACRGGDGCCPPGCTAATDADCAATCGDGKVGVGETCDPPSTCPTTCPDDGDRCTRERLTGDAAHCSAACAHEPITACSGQTADLCCPTGCTHATDVDC